MVAAIITFPVVTSMSAGFIGGSTSDAYEMARHIWWFKYALQNGLDLFHQSNLGYPDGISGVTLWSNPLQFFPAWLFAFFMPLATAYNLAIFISMGLNGWSMYWLARDRTGKHIPAVLAGLVFMGFPVFQGHLFDGHAGLMVMWGAPLLIYSLFHLHETPSARWLGLSVFFFFLTPLGHMLQIIYVLLPIMTAFLAAYLWKRDRLGVEQTIWVGGIGGALLLLFLSPVIQETFSNPAYTDAAGYVRFSTDLLGVISPSFLHPFFGNVLSYPRQVLGINLAEGSTYIGIIGGILLLIAALRQRESRWWLLLAVLSWYLSLGPLLKFLDQPVTVSFDAYESHLMLLPWALLPELPGFSVVRTPGRFAFTLAIAVAMLAGYGLATLWQHQKRSAFCYGLVGLLMVGIIWEYQFFWPLPTQPAIEPDVLLDIRDDSDIRAVYNIPWDNLLAAKDALYLQTIHQKPLIAGQVSRRTPVNPAMLALLQQTLNPVQLDEVGADVVILHLNRAREMRTDRILLSRAEQQLGDAVYNDGQIAVFNVPDAGRASNFAAAPPTESVVTNTSTIYIYAPEPGWVRLDALASAEDRDVRITLNNHLMNQLMVSEDTSLRLSLPIITAGYHSLSLELLPPCPTTTSPALTCRTLLLDNVDLVPLTSGPVYEPIALENGVELGAFHVDESDNDQLSVSLWWRFAQPIGDTEVRFLHVIGADNRLVAQNDLPIGPFAAGQEWAETITIPIDTLAPGQYRVRTGWYTFPAATRFAVLDNVPGARDDTVEIGAFRVP